MNLIEVWIFSMLNFKIAYQVVCITGMINQSLHVFIRISLEENFTSLKNIFLMGIGLMVQL